MTFSLKICFFLNFLFISGKKKLFKVLQTAKINSTKLTHFDLSNRENFYLQKMYP